MLGMNTPEAMDTVLPATTSMQNPFPATINQNPLTLQDIVEQTKRAMIGRLLERARTITDMSIESFLQSAMIFVVPRPVEQLARFPEISYTT